jgi:hypothetical protein
MAIVISHYDHATDVLITKKKAPPADGGNRALILHECVHAMVDIIDPKTTITRHIRAPTQATQFRRRSKMQQPAPTGGPGVR